MIELSDDGKGFEVTDDALAPHPERKRIGVANVNDRIQLNFGRKYGLKINSQPGEKEPLVPLTLPELLCGYAFIKYTTGACLKNHSRNLPQIVTTSCRKPFSNTL